MKKHLSASGIYVGGGVIVIAVTIFAIFKPTYALSVVCAALAAVVLCRIGDWWRRTYFVTIILMACGSSSMESVVGFASRGKVLSLLLLVGATILTIKGEPTYSGKMHKWLLSSLWILVIFAGISTLWSTYKVGTFISAMTVAALVFVLHRVSTVRWNDRPKLAGDIGAAYLAMLIPVAIGLALASVGSEKAVLWNGRHQGFYSNPNMLGLMSLLTATLGIAYATHRRSALVWATTLAPLTALVLSGSRTAFIAAVVAIVWVLIRGSAARAVGGLFAVALGFVLFGLAGKNPFESY